MNTQVQIKRLSKKELEEHLSNFEDENPAIYVGTYHKYNCGSIFGKWLDLTTFDDADELDEFCRRLHFDEEDPEFMIQDFECFPRIWYNESGLPDDETLEKIKEFANIDDAKKKAYEEYLSDYSDGSIDDFDDKFIGCYDSFEEYAREYVEECGYLNNLPPLIKNNIDYEAIGRELSYDVHDYNGYFLLDC